MKSIKLNQIQESICNILSINLENKKRGVVDLFNNYSEKYYLDFTNNNEITSIIYHELLNINYDHLSDYWLVTHERIQTKIKSFLEELDQISALFVEKNILIIALKNTGIARGLYDCPGCCPMGDIDVLIEKKNFQKAHEILLSKGFQFKFRSELEKEDIEFAETSGGSEYWKLLPNGEKLWFELQWRPIAGRWIRPDQEPDAGELFERSLPIQGTSVRLLSPEDNLLQVCLHTAKHSYVRAPGFRLHLDVQRIVNGLVLNWDVFLERVKRFNVKTAVYFSLIIPHELFQTPIPENVLNELKPSKWKENLIISMINKAGLFNPLEKKFSKAGYILFNILLYDDMKGLFLSIFPPRESIKAKYRQFQNKPLLFIYFVRFYDLIFRRNKV